MPQIRSVTVVGEHLYMLPTDMNLKIRPGTVGYNNKILVSDSKFNLGKNDEVNLVVPAMKSRKTNSLETPAIKNHKTNSIKPNTIMSQSIPTGYIPPGQPLGKFF